MNHRSGSPFQSSTSPARRACKVPSAPIPNRRWHSQRTCAEVSGSCWSTMTKSLPVPCAFQKVVIASILLVGRQGGQHPRHNPVIKVWGEGIEPLNAIVTAVPHELFTGEATSANDGPTTGLILVVVPIQIFQHLAVPQRTARRQPFAETDVS